MSHAKTFIKGQNTELLRIKCHNLVTCRVMKSGVMVSHFVMNNIGGNGAYRLVVICVFIDTLSFSQIVAVHITGHDYPWSD